MIAPCMGHRCGCRPSSSLQQFDFDFLVNKDSIMTPENFCYWLQGTFELGKINSLDEVQVQEIKNHLALVLTKITPSHPLRYAPGDQAFLSPPYTVTCSSKKATDIV